MVSQDRGCGGTIVPHYLDYAQVLDDALRLQAVLKNSVLKPEIQNVLLRMSKEEFWPHL